VNLPDLSGLRLLVVDDDDDALFITAHLLRACGASVVEARNAWGALGYLETHQFDVVVTDLAMPQMDGTEFLRRVRARQDARRIAVIALTAFPERYVPELGVSFDAFLRKPVEIDDLAKAILNASAARRRPSG
jgi:CheY-like chemotaxis protein